VLALSTRRTATAGVLAGAAIATKLYPALILPSMLRRRPLVVVGAAIGTVALSYVPHVAAVGAKVIGYLPGYLREERYANGQRFLLIPAGRASTALAVLVLLAVAAWVARRSDPDRPEATAVVLAGAAILVATPSFGWYCGLLLALIVLSGQIAWLPVALAPGLWYLVHGDLGAPVWAGRLIFGSVLVLTLAGLAATRRPHRTPVLRGEEQRDGNGVLTAPRT
jgi:hypothetical protein